MLPSYTTRTPCSFLISLTSYRRPGTAEAVTPSSSATHRSYRAPGSVSPRPRRPCRPRAPTTPPPPPPRSTASPRRHRLLPRRPEPLHRHRPSRRHRLRPSPPSAVSPSPLHRWISHVRLRLDPRRVRLFSIDRFSLRFISGLVHGLAR